MEMFPTRRQRDPNPLRRGQRFTPAEFIRVYVNPVAETLVTKVPKRATKMTSIV